MAPKQNLHKSAVNVKFIQPGDIHELRVLSEGRSPTGGLYSDPQALARDAEKATSRGARGGYCTLNPRIPDPDNPPKNTAGPLKTGTRDQDIDRRLWLPIDIDPTRPDPKLSATDDEHQHALTLGKHIQLSLDAMGWPAPIYASSGNGAHLLYRVEEPNDAETTDLFKRCLLALAALFDNEHATVDTGVYNASRIWKVYGTWARKGPDTPERPHRMACIIMAPPEPEIVTREQLRHLADRIPDTPTKATQRTQGGIYVRDQIGAGIDVEQYATDHSLEVAFVKDWDGSGKRLVLARCPFDPDHDNRSAVLLQFASGAVSFRCLHNSCADHDWHALRDKVEPGWRERHQAADQAPVTLEPPDMPAWVPFPVSALPEPISSYVSASAHARQVNPAAVALPMLASVAAAVGNSRVLKSTPSWRVPAVLWALIVMLSGTGKTPAFGSALYPLRAVQRRLRAAWERMCAGIGDEEKKPTEPRIVTADITAEGAALFLSRQPKGGLCAPDEASSFLGGFGRYTGASTAERAFWLSTYNAESVSIDRKKDGHIYAARGAFSVCGTIQPQVMKNAADENTLDSGTIARFMLCWPPEPRRSWQHMRSAQNPDDVTIVALFERLYALSLCLDEPFELTLSDESAAVYGEFFDANEQIRRETEPGPYRAALSKLEELPLRLALLFALVCDDPDHVTTVSADAMHRAVTVAEWVRDEQRRVYSLLLETEGEKLARQLVDYIVIKGAVTAREVAQGMWRYRGPEGTKRATDDLKQLEDQGVLESVQVSGARGPAAVRWHLRVEQDRAESGTSTSTGFKNDNPNTPETKDLELSPLKPVDVEAGEVLKTQDLTRSPKHLQVIPDADGHRRIEL